MPTDPIKKDALKITNQFRAKRGMVYELSFEGAKLTLHVSPRENPDDAGEWRIEASPGHAPEGVVIEEWGATKADALRAVGRRWHAEGPARGLTMFDWDAVALLLGTVRAI